MLGQANSTIEGPSLVDEVWSVIGTGDGVTDGLADGLYGERHLDVPVAVALSVDGAEGDAPELAVHAVQLRDVTRSLKPEPSRRGVFIPPGAECGMPTVM